MHTLSSVIVAVGVGAWIVAHQLVIYYVLSTLVEQLPPPMQNGNVVYRYFYSVLQIFAANWARGLSSPKPPSTPKP